jgi:multiple sugar transport system substrate-binding protein
MRKNSLRPLHLLLIFALILVTFNGCASKVNKDQKTKLTLWIMPNSQEPVNDLKAILEPFEKANPNIEVDVVSLDWGSAWQKITTAATSADVPDVVQLGSTWVGSISSMGAMLDVKKFTDEIKGEEIFVPAAWATRGPVNSGKVFAVPWIVDVRALYYRTDIFKKLGLTAANLANWSEFEKTLDKIKRARLVIAGKEVQPLGITGKNDWNVIHNLSPWMWAMDGDYLSADSRKATINKPEAVKGLYYYINLVRRGFVPVTCLEQNTAQISSGFNNGLYAMYFDGPFALKALTTPPERGGSSDLPVAKNFANAPYPKSPIDKSATYAGGSHLAIFKLSKNKEAALKLIKYLTTDPYAQLNYCKITGFLPAVKELVKDPYFTSDANRKVFAQSLDFSKPYPCVPSWGPLETTVLTRRFGLMWDRVLKDLQHFDEETMQEEMNTAAREMDAVLNQYQ